MDLGKLIENNAKTLELENLENDVKDIHVIYKNINEIINIQGQQLDNIVDNMENTNNNLDKTTDDIIKAEKYFQSYKKYTYILTGIGIIGTILLIL